MTPRRQGRSRVEMPLSRGKSQKRNASGKGVANSVQNSRNSSQPGDISSFYFLYVLISFSNGFRC